VFVFCTPLQKLIRKRAFLAGSGRDGRISWTLCFLFAMPCGADKHTDEGC